MLGQHFLRQLPCRRFPKSRSCIVLLQCIKWRGLLGQTVNNTSRATAIPILSFIVAGSRYHYCGSAVLVLGIEVTAPVMGVDEASQPAVQSEVGDVVRGEHQQVVGFFPPAYLVLFARHKKTRSHLLLTVTKQRGDSFFFFFFLSCTLKCKLSYRWLSHGCRNSKA